VHYLKKLYITLAALAALALAAVNNVYWW